MLTSIWLDTRGRVQSKTKTTREGGLLTGKLVHLALPVRWSTIAEKGRGPVELACTYDIHPRGARLLGFREVKVGDLVMVERGHNKAVCQVVWTGARDSQLRGQFTVQCVEQGRTPWDDELRQVEEQYQPVILDGRLNRSSNGTRGESNRRRRPRYSVEGKADVIDGLRRIAGEVQQLSEFGARIATKNLLCPGTDFRLLLNVFDVSVVLKAQVKYLADSQGMGVEFQEIRRGDRPLFNYVMSKIAALSRLGTKNPWESTKVEVITGRLAAAAAAG